MKSKISLATTICPISNSCLVTEALQYLEGKLWTRVMVKRGNIVSGLYQTPQNFRYDDCGYNVWYFQGIHAFENSEQYLVSVTVMVAHF